MHKYQFKTIRYSKLFIVPSLTILITDLRKDQAPLFSSSCYFIRNHHYILPKKKAFAFQIRKQRLISYDRL